jgi:hypothetical protein
MRPDTTPALSFSGVTAPNAAALTCEEARIDQAASATWPARCRRRSPTLHAVVFEPNFFGAGNRPALTQRQTVGALMPFSAATTGSRTLAESGSWSNYASAAGISGFAFSWVTNIASLRNVGIGPATCFYAVRRSATRTIWIGLKQVEEIPKKFWLESSIAPRCSRALGSPAEPPLPGRCPALADLSGFAGRSFGRRLRQERAAKRPTDRQIHPRSRSVQRPRDHRSRSNPVATLLCSK